ncbi:sigma 54-interacting transcriptional regulator [Enterovibrio sp. Hal110]
MKASADHELFVPINCGAVPENLFESELFGHEVGAFTGASKRRIGKLEYADKGTLFLDEIESMPAAMQVKVLRSLQENTVERVGGNQSIHIDLRVIAAAKEDLGAPVVSARSLLSVKCGANLYSSTSRSKRRHLDVV